MKIGRARRWKLPERLRRPAGAVWNTCHRLYRGVVVWLPAYVSAARALRRRADQAVLVWPAPDVPLGPDVVVFVHFDAGGELRPGARRYLAALRQTGRSIVLASNAGWLWPADLEAARGLCDGLLIRRNVGYDFGAMREAVTRFGLPRTGTDETMTGATNSVLIVNDSVIGPFAPLEPLLAGIDFTVADVWGATDSVQRGYHLQSFFVAFGRRALTHPAWAAFWRGVLPVQSKQWVIAHYEVGLTRRLLAAGLRCQALFPYEALLASAALGPAMSSDHARQRRHRRRVLARGHKLNPTADLWRELLRAGFPFVKRELVLRNPGRVADVADWQAEIHLRQAASGAPSGAVPLSEE